MVYKKAIGMSKQLFQTWKTRSFMNATLAILLDQTMNAHPLNLTQCLIVLTDSSGGSFHWWKTFYHIPQGSSTPGKTILTWTPVNVLAICTGSNHRLTYWAYCSGIPCWLAQLGYLFTHETCSTTDYKVPQHLVKRFHHKCQSTFWPFLLDQTKIETFWAQCSGTECWLSPPGGWTPFHLWEMLYHRSEGSSITKRNFDMEASQCSGHLYWIKPWTETFWAHCSGT